MRYEALRSVLDERQLRLWAAAEARALGRGGVAAVTRATGIRGKRTWNGMRDLWKQTLQGIADRTGLEITVCLCPPGTSKWNKIEHRMFSHISQNWRGRPLVDHETIVSLVANTRAKSGLKVRSRLDKRTYPLGTMVTDAATAGLALRTHAFHGDWNHTLSPRSRAPSDHRATGRRSARGRARDLHGSGHRGRGVVRRGPADGRLGIAGAGLSQPFLAGAATARVSVPVTWRVTAPSGDCHWKALQP